NAFKSLLAAGYDFIAPADDKRTAMLGLSPVTAYLPCGQVASFADFDYRLFGLSKREALHMEPQQRVLLQLTYLALLDCGYKIKSLKGSNTGVFVAGSASNYANLIGHNEYLTGTLPAALAG
ncbi:beta-ketoacyl synthase N-terminal-like domain-containing protein, partial [Pseudoalteromonas piscicida]|uniref:beta-ketoacyl synthase N-terminal-like domain-containing protein n=1 Tax=Pseudoalteromonas piscicida TaxID=43662 RepID=UPI0011084405